jgi:hypothetical protein
MSSMLFLRSTEQIAKLHLVSELGRIGDAQGALPIMQFLAEPEDERGRGTAVFALGEIGNEKATPLLKGKYNGLDTANPCGINRNIAGSSGMPDQCGRGRTGFDCIDKIRVSN